MPTTTTMTTQPKASHDKAEPPQTSGRPLDEYMALDYPVELVRDGDEWVASNPDLPGCSSFGPDPNSAVENLSNVRSLWIEGEISSGNEIPEPADDNRYSGKFVLRIPKGLHRLADYRARREGVSLNSLIGNLLSGALGYCGTDKRQQPELTSYYTYCAPSRGSYQDPYDAPWHKLLPAFEKGWSIAPTKSEDEHSVFFDQSLMTYLHHFAGQLGSHQKRVFATEDYRRAKEKNLASK
jgi:antitoxin HicB